VEEDARTVLARYAGPDVRAEEVRAALAGVGSEEELFVLLVEATADRTTFSDAQRAGLTSCLASRPLDEVGAVLAGLEPTSAPSAREAGMRVLLERPSADAVGLAVRWLSAHPTTLDALYQDLVTRALEQDGQAAGRCRELLHDRGTVHPTLIRGVADWSSPESLVLLSSCLLDTHPGLPVALEGFGRRAAELGKRDETHLAEVRRYLRDGRQQVVIAATRACALLRDTAAMEDLVILLDSPRSAVRGAACATLRELSGVAYGADSACWTVWLKQERGWWEERGEALQDELHSDDPVTRLRAIGEAARHPLYHEQLAAPVASSLFDEHDVLRRLACIALEDLGALGWTDELVPLLADPSFEVREACHRALRTLTGQDLPARRDAWQDWMETRR